MIPLKTNQGVCCCVTTQQHAGGCNLTTCKQNTVQSKALSEGAIVTVKPSIHGLHRHYLAYAISQELTQGLIFTFH